VRREWYGRNARAAATRRKVKVEKKERGLGIEEPERNVEPERNGQVGEFNRGRAS